MKKIFILIICILLMSFTGCGQSSTQQEPTTEIVEEQNVIENETIQTPNSTAFSSIGYDAEEECLIVTFRDSGTTYYYPGFPYEEWAEFKQAESLGSYFNQNIKPNYDYSEKVDGKKETEETTTEKQTTKSASTSQKHDYVANMNSKKFHYDWCGSVDQMKESNKKYYNNTTRDVLIADGYDPCKQCNP